MGLSNLGIFHTIIGVIAIVAAIVSYIKSGKINLAISWGKIYLFATIITAITALGISKRGGFNPGHFFSVVILVLALIAWYLFSRKQGTNRSRYFENFCLTFSFFLSWLPTVNETFTRIPVGHPLAKDITDPVISITLLSLFILFVAGSVLQYYQQKKLNLAASNVKK